MFAGCNSVRGCVDKMRADEQQKLLDLLDRERQTIIMPNVTRFAEAGVIRDVSVDGRNAEVVYASCSEAQIDQAIQQQMQMARNAGYELEWKLYGHDRPQSLGERLAAAGFQAGDREAFMALVASSEALQGFGPRSGDIRRVTNRQDLRDYQTVQEKVYGINCDAKIKQYGQMLADHPNNLSMYVAYVDGEPAACGRTYFHADSRFAGLYGGQTRAQFRKRGLFTQLVAVRIQEALNRGVINICVDALPTSEPILRKHGFESLTYTQPFTFAG